MHDSIHSRRNLTEEDLEDQKKEEDERFLLEQVQNLLQLIELSSQAPPIMSKTLLLVSTFYQCMGRYLSRLLSIPIHMINRSEV